MQEVSISVIKQEGPEPQNIFAVEKYRRATLQIPQDQSSQVIDLLKSNYDTYQKVQDLISGGNILTLGETKETTIYSGVAAEEFTEIDEAESQLITHEFNFVFIGENRWTYRKLNESFYKSL